MEPDFVASWNMCPNLSKFIEWGELITWLLACPRIICISVARRRGFVTETI
jgi:hypothetical protein